MNEKEIVIDEEIMADYIYERLIALGYAPGESEVDDLASIFFDFLVDKEIIADVTDEYR